MFRGQKDKGFTIVELLIVVVVIAILAAITIVSYGGITQRAKEAALAADISQLQTKAAVYRTQHNINDCPSGYSFVYGNAVLGTSPFCVMKYEAKIQGSDNGQATYAASMVAESRATGTPWVNINQTQAITEAVEVGGHLLTEAEWMTIAADVLSVKQNWSGGEVGSGIIYQGHVNDNPASALSASDDDTDALSGITGGVGNTSGNNSSRVLYLSSGDAIWDFSGNVWEWTQQTIGTPTLTVSNIGIPGDSSLVWREYTNSSLSLGNLATVSRPATLNSWSNPVNNVSLSGLVWGASKGVGQINSNYADSTAHAFRRGGRWGNGVYAGVLALNLYDSSSSAYADLGFRVAR